MNGKLSHQLIDEYFDNHLPYRTRILLAHYKMRHTATGTFVPRTGNQAWLDSCFVASLVTARLYLNMFGIGKNRDGTALVNYKGRVTDMTVEKLGGDRVDFTTMSVADQKMLLAFIIMADQAAAHFTTPKPHDRGPIPKVIKLIHSYLKTALRVPIGVRVAYPVGECLHGLPAKSLAIIEPRGDRIVGWGLFFMDPTKRGFV